jgi:DNA-binding SARP family transcriptional activator
VTHHEYTGQLLDRAFRRLLPDVFFHPAWTHFVEAGAPFLPEQVQSLQDAGDGLLAAGKLVEACQILFICAFQQLRAGDYTAASNNTQRILILAEQHGLPHVARWATWGAAAVCVRRGWFQEAAEHLAHLQSQLSQQQEWVLSNVIDIIRRALLSHSQAEIAAGQPLSSDAVLSSAFEQMLHWGTPRAVSAISSNGLIDHAGQHTYVAPSPSGTGGFTWRSFWRSIRRFIKGELRLKWVETNRSALLLLPDERNVPTVDSIVAPSTPASFQSLSQPAWPVSPDQMSTPNQLSTAHDDQRSAPDDLPASEQQPEPDRASTLPRPDQMPAPNQMSTLNQDQRSAPDQLLTSEQQPEPDRMSTSKHDQSTGLEQPDPTRPAAPPSITAHLLGAFSFSVNDAAVQSWPTGKGRAVLKYMLAHHDQPIPRDVLMDVFWPQAGPEAARNSLNVALHGLRQALKTVTDKPVVLFEEGSYGINPEFHVWVDADEFDRHVQAGRRLEAKEQLARAAAEYEAAVELYQGDFLAGDPYEEWPVLLRERHRVAYLDILDRLSQIYFNQRQYADCVTLCQLALARDACREDIHCLLMRCYSRQGQRQLALRQYQICVEALHAELEVEPAPETTQLYQRIRRRERV